MYHMLCRNIVSYIWFSVAVLCRNITYDYTEVIKYIKNKGVLLLFLFGIPRFPVLEADTSV